MKSILALSFSSLVILAGCNADTDSKNQQGKTYQFQWASFEEQKIKQLIEKDIEKNAVLPNELNFNETEQYQKRNKMSQSVRTLEQAIRESCRAKFSSSASNQPIAREQRGLQGGLAIIDSAAERGVYNESNKEYADCISAGRDNPEINELKKNMEKEDNLQRKKLDFIRSLKQNSERVLRQYVAEYAQTNQLDLILSRQSDAVIYNKNEGVLDITAPLETYIQSKLNAATRSTQ